MVLKTFAYLLKLCYNKRTNPPNKQTSGGNKDENMKIISALLALAMLSTQEGETLEFTKAEN